METTLKILISTLALLPIITGCKVSPPRGTERGPCLNGNQCNEGLVCGSGLCVKMRNSIPKKNRIDVSRARHEVLNPNDVPFLLNYAARHPFNSKRISYNANTGKVIYRANRPHGRRKTNIVEAHAVDFISMLAQHIPHRRRHQFRYYGATNPKVRKRLELTGESVPPAAPEVTASRGRRSWARLIWKLYGVDPLVCPKCGGQRIILAVIFDDESLSRIAAHLGLPAQPPAQAPARAPPAPPVVERDTRIPVTPPSDGDELLLVDPDTDRWDAMDEPQESDHWEAERPQEPEEQQERANKPENLLDVMNRWPGMVRWADELSEDREQQPEPTNPGI